MINTDFFKPLENVKKYQDKVLFVGRLSREKNLSTLFEALKGTGLSLDIVGRGDMKKFLMKKAEQLNLHVNFLGIIENSKMPDVYNRYYVYILPSFYEGLPKTLLEAMGSGLACIGTNVYGIKEIIINNVNGFLVGLNKKSINKAIMELTDNKELCLELGRRARQDVLDNYSFDSLIKVEVNLYEKLF